MLNLDTHILLGALAGKLSRREHELLASQPWSIAATSLAHRVPLVTRDRRIRRSHLVPLTRV